MRDGAIMLDLSGMKAVQVDPETRTVRAAARAHVGRVRPRHAGVRDWRRTLGVVSVTGIAGLTLGGGLGWLNGCYGLACDNLISADVVTADGQLLRASTQENEDLFWGIRGGGGNFGVVTSFEYQLHPVDLVLAGALSYPLSMAPQVLRFYDDFVKAAPDELSTAVSLALTPTGEPTVFIVVCYCGPIDEGEQVLYPLRTFQSPVDDSIQPMPYTALQSARDEGFPSGRLHYWKSGWLRDLTDGAIETLMQFLPHYALLRQRRRPATDAWSGEPYRPIGHRLSPSGRAVRLPHLVAVVRRDRLGSQHRMDQCAVPGDAATPRGVGVREQPR